MNGQVLVTGATGFIGSYLATELVRRGQAVRCLVRQTSSPAALTYLRELGANLLRGDLTDPASLQAAVNGVSTVYHLGGGGTFGMRDDTCFRINVLGTRNLLDGCASGGPVAKFVHVSTCGVMGNITHPPANESYPGRPEGYTYARAKAEAEKVALAFRDRVPVVVTRFPMVYGPPLFAERRPMRLGGVTPLLPILSMIRRGRWAYIGDGQALTHWTYIDDIVQGLVLAADRGRPGEVYILAGRQWCTMQEFAETLAAILGVPMPRRRISPMLARLVAAGAELPARLTGRTLRGLVDSILANRAFDISKARRELSYEPQVDLDEGIRRTVRWYEEQGYLPTQSAA